MSDPKTCRNCGPENGMCGWDKPKTLNIPNCPCPDGSRNNGECRIHEVYRELKEENEMLIAKRNSDDSYKLGLLDGHQMKGNKQSMIYEKGYGDGYNECTFELVGMVYERFKLDREMSSIEAIEEHIKQVQKKCVKSANVKVSVLSDAIDTAYAKMLLIGKR